VQAIKSEGGFVWACKNYDGERSAFGAKPDDTPCILSQWRPRVRTVMKIHTVQQRWLGRRVPAPPLAVLPVAIQAA